MAPLFEPVVILVVMSILVALFTWIYLRDRRREFGLWLLGWSAIFVHFTVPLAEALVHLKQPIADWLFSSSLVVAGTFFLLSVSLVLRHPRERARELMRLHRLADEHELAEFRDPGSPAHHRLVEIIERLARAPKLG